MRRTWVGRCLIFGRATSPSCSGIPNRFAFAGSTLKDVTITGGNEITLKAAFA